MSYARRTNKNARRNGHFYKCKKNKKKFVFSKNNCKFVAVTIIILVL